MELALRFKLLRIGRLFQSSRILDLTKIGSSTARDIICLLTIVTYEYSYVFIRFCVRKRFFFFFFEIENYTIFAYLYSINTFSVYILKLVSLSKYKLNDCKIKSDKMTEANKTKN